MRVALLSNVTVDLLAGMLRKSAEVYLPPGFDTWQQEMIIPGSGLYEFRPDAVVVLLHAGFYDWSDFGSGLRMIDEWCGAFSAVTTTLPGVPVFISSLDISIRAHYGAELRFEGKIESYLIEKIQGLHSDGANAYILPVKDVVTDLGRRNFYSDKMWYVGSMPYSIKGLSAVNELILRYVSVTKGMKKKCMAVDLDNTLWGGVIGEDGVWGLQLSKHKEGQRYYDTQKILKKMKDQGVMLAILSKNNAEDVEPVYKHPDMVLQHEDFVAEAINWDSKSANIRQLARDLNIGLDSFVFLDDNPAERERMKAECPEVSVIEFPKDSSQLPAAVERAYNDFFLSLEVTGEDTKKTAMYRDELRRKAEMLVSASAEKFFEKLEMVMDIHYMKDGEIKRVTQLINKTNQFNVTTKRYSEEEVLSLASSDGSDIITVHMSDKYGNQGLVAVLILKYEGDGAVIDTFLMSCRVMGRNAEVEIMSNAKRLLEKKGIREIRAMYLKTAKNAPVAGLFEKLGFDVVSSSQGRMDYIASIDSLPDSTGVFKEVNCEL